MYKEKRVLVVGTTFDYIELLGGLFPNRVVFVTDIKEKIKDRKSKSSSIFEIVLDLEDQISVINSLKNYLRVNNIEPSGVVCFDCESMALAAVIAQQFGLHYSSINSIINCRSKYLSKKIWKENYVMCPDAVLINREADIEQAYDYLNGPVVLKPLTGSGGELVYYCEDLESCIVSYQSIMKNLQNHSNSRMYTLRHMPKTEDPKKVIVMEQYISGIEYSCDFIIKGNDLQLLRLSRKYNFDQSVFGSILAYELPAKLPDDVDIEEVKKILLKASNSLGLHNSIIMADFKIQDNKVILLELTPRPGGDCLPPLIKASSRFDILKATLDLAEGKKVIIPDSKCWEKVVGLHIFATKRGILKKVDLQGVESDLRVRECFLKCSQGDVIELPPEDYDSRILGYIIFKPALDQTVESQCCELAGKLIVEIE